MIPIIVHYGSIFLKLWSKVSQMFLLFSLYFSSFNCKYLKLTKMDITRFATSSKYLLFPTNALISRENGNTHPRPCSFCIQSGGPAAAAAAARRVSKYSKMSWRVTGVYSILITIIMITGPDLDVWGPLGRFICGAPNRHIVLWKRASLRTTGSFFLYFKLAPVFWHNILMVTTQFFIKVHWALNIIF